MITAPCRFSASWQSLELVCAFCMLMLPAVDPILAQSYKVDGSDSQSLTTYLRQHRLPLVGAQVLDDGAGNRRIVLYGFVASQFGRSDAASKALSYYAEYLKQSGTQAPPIENHIEIRPEIARMRTHAEGAAAAETPNKSLDEVLGDIDRFGVKMVPAQTNPK